MLPLIQAAIIDKKHWIAADEFTELLTLAQTAPGPIAVNAAVLVGYKQRGAVGAVAAILGVTLPSLIIILLIAVFFSSIRNNHYVDSAFKGMRPAVVALIIGPVVTLARGMEWWKIIIAMAVAAALWYWGFSPIYVLLAGAAAGIAYELTVCRKKHKEGRL